MIRVSIHSDNSLSRNLSTNRCRFDGVSQQQSNTKLFLHPTAGASIALTASSLIGMQISRWVPSGGILGTLLSAAVMGNALPKLIPTNHFLYDLCFTLFLPGSLTLLLLAYRPPPGLTVDNKQSKHKQSQNSIAACVRRVAAPFIIASLASLLGCWLSYHCANYFHWFNVDNARAATACLSASYVGGSVNCMATARLIKAQPDLLGSLVTADLFTMAIYFAFLSSSLEWPWLLSKFNPGFKRAVDNVEDDSKTASAVVDDTNDTNGRQSTSLFSKVFFTSPILLFGTYCIVEIANKVESMVGSIVPGMACAVISIVAPYLNSLLLKQSWWTTCCSSIASIWSDFFFLSFFGSIGLAANLSSALSMGPSCILFSSIALGVHVLLTVLGSLLWNSNKQGDLELEDVWIASNAAIGGPATAAAFCSRMKRDLSKLQGRTIAATVWGVVGYAIGTILGISMYRIVGGVVGV